MARLSYKLKLILRLFILVKVRSIAFFLLFKSIVFYFIFRDFKSKIIFLTNIIGHASFKN